MSTQETQAMDRRQFLGKAATAAAGLTIVRASAVAGTQANSAIEVGLIGSGRRGCWIGKHFLEKRQLPLRGCR